MLKLTFFLSFLFFSAFFFFRVLATWKSGEETWPACRIASCLRGKSCACLRPCFNLDPKQLSHKLRPVCQVFWVETKNQKFQKKQKKAVYQPTKHKKNMYNPVKPKKTKKQQKNKKKNKKKQKSKKKQKHFQ